MQTLGISDSTPRTESRWRALFWPTIRSEGDLDYVSRQGFWICFVVAVVSLIFGAFTGVFFASLFDVLFFFLAGVGIRQQSRIAGIAAFVAYFLTGVMLQKDTGSGFNITRITFLALLFANVRGNWLSARWRRERELQPPPLPLSQTWGDKLADQLPIFLWPKVRIVFYVLAALELILLLVGIAMPRPPAL